MKNKINALNAYIKSCGKVMVAYSGGIDSSFMLKLCVEAVGRKNVLAVTGASETFTDVELSGAKKFAKSVGVGHVIVTTREIDNPDFRSNPPLRCYHCKKEFYTKLAEVAKKCGFKYIFDGSNKDDTSDYRPGRRAAQEIGIISPLIKFGIDKAELRRLAKKMGIRIWDKPSNPCLASRVPYGEEITEEKLGMIYKAETFIRSRGFKNIRVRHHGKLARIEVPENEIIKLLKEPLRSKIIKELNKIGFAWVSVDMKGYRTGSLNEILGLKKAKG
ncbi:MAG TPA: ATP-dependent sacrificial sulfur transferase LarE [Lentisphaeria bacterium]|nr:ATP-dependent sacrificial sulfur transferase LarE [Lentisphaeria bacterium]